MASPLTREQFVEQVLQYIGEKFPLVKVSRGEPSFSLRIDGQIASPARTPERPDSHLSPDAIAETYLAVHRQHRSAWSFEVDLRPWVETF